MVPPFGVLCKPEPLHLERLSGGRNGVFPFEPECSSGDSVPGRSNGKKSPSLFQTLFGKGRMQDAAAFSQLWRPSKCPDENRWDFEPGKMYRKLKLASCLCERAL